MRLPLTLRILFHALRSFWAAGVLALFAWVFLASASPQERQGLGAQAGTDRPTGLIPMRAARLLVHIAPDRTARMMSLASGGEVSPEFARAMLQGIATGRGPDPVITAEAAPQDAPSRMADGAKFVQVDQP